MRANTRWQQTEADQLRARLALAAMAANDYRKRLDTRLVERNVPQYLRNGVVEYLVMRRPMGGFLTAVAENDLAQAVTRADGESILSIFSLVQFFYNNAPSACWGSPAKVAAWLAETDVPEAICD